MAHAPYVFMFALLNRARAATLAAQVTARMEREEERLVVMMTERGIPVDTARLWMNGDDHWLTPTEAFGTGILTVEPPKAPQASGEEPDETNDVGTGNSADTTADEPNTGQALSLIHI